MPKTIIILSDEDKKRYEERAVIMQQRSLIQRQKLRNKYKKHIRKPKRLNGCFTFINNSEFYNSVQWKELRFITLRKYGYGCMACGRRAPRFVIHVDHIKPRSLFPELQLDPNNLQVLCSDCNIGKKNYFQDDLRRRK